MRKNITYIFLMLVITDLVILADMPYLRQSIPFIIFNILPGYLLLNILKINKLKFLERIILSVGLSISLLMFTGLILNSFYPIIREPLSLIPVITSLNILVLTLLMIYFLRVEKIDLNFNFSHLDGKIIPMMFSIVFPLLTIGGSYMMNYYSNNVLLLVTLLIIPVYLILLTILRKNIHPATYPVALFNIALALLIMNGLPSNYLIGRDIHREYYYFELTIQNYHWNAFLPYSYNAYNACISITILPAIYNSLLNIPPMYIFKFYYGILGAFIPLGVYLISERVLKNNSLAFYAALLFVFQFSFIYLLGWERQVIALLFFTLAFMILFGQYIRGYAEKLLFIIFLISTVFSHYTTSYIFLIIIALIPIIWGILEKLSKIKNPRLFWVQRIYERFNPSKEKYSQFISVSLAILLFVVIFAWYAQVTYQPFNDMMTFIGNTFFSMGNFAAQDMHNSNELAIMGIGLTVLPNILSAVINNIIFVIIGTAVLIILFKPNYTRYNITIEYLIAVIVSIGLLASFIILPYVSQGYGGTRLFTQLLVIIAPLFIIGIQSITKLIKKPNMNLAIILIILMLLFSCTTYLQYHFSGIPYSYAYDVNSENHYETYIYDSEVFGVSWLNNNAEKNSTIHCDAFGYSRILLYGNALKFDNLFFNRNKSISTGYIYLRYVNVNQNLVFSDVPATAPILINNSLKMDNVYNISEYQNLFNDKNLIYDDGGSEVMGGN